MTRAAAAADTDATRSTPPTWAGAVSGALVVLVFTAVHDLLISDIWFNLGPMLFAGALCGLCLAWSYRTVVDRHTLSAWWRYNGIYVTEMIALGGVSLAVLHPRWTMGELMVADDAFERLLPPSMPLMIGAMLVGTVGIWLWYGRRPAAVAPILTTQVLLVFLLGHQFAFLGLVETSTALLLVFAEFALITVGLAGAFAAGVMWLGRLGAKRARHSI